MEAKKINKGRPTGAPPTPGLVTVQAFAKLAGVHITTVQKAISSGHIKESIQRPAGLVRLHPEKSREEWGRNYRHYPDSPPHLAEWLGAGAEPLTASGGRHTEEGILKMGRGDAERVAAAFKAAQARLAYLERTGELVAKKDVYAALYEKGQALRRQIEAIPGRIVDAVMAAPDRHRAVLAAEAEVEVILREMADLDGMKLKGGRG